ncbi:hypothetical protein V6N13_026928 [Hibiscus sabdariffa]
MVGALAVNNSFSSAWISHEAPVTGGFGAEISASIVENCFLRVSDAVCYGLLQETPSTIIFFLNDGIGRHQSNRELLKKSRLKLPDMRELTPEEEKKLRFIANAPSLESRG